MVQKLLLLSLTLLSATVAFAQETVNVSDANFADAKDYYWTSENTYILTDMVFVRPGARLFIEAGTLVKGNSGSGNNATGLVITRGAQIFAEGTADNPIIFTAAADQRDGSASNELRGLWGGLVVLGAATTNNATEGGVKLIEGVNEIANPATLAEYGGDNDDDNSGVIRYVSIRHTGINVGDVDGNEIQGLTLGGVGRGTTIEYVESFASNDDGFEWFGGTVDAKYLVSAFNTDDGFDWDEGFRGRGQFWFVVQNNAVADGYGRGMEMDGATGDENTTPYAKPILSNITILGAGIGAGANEGDGSQLLLFRDNTGAEVYNSIFGEQDGFGVQVEDIDNSGSKPFDSRQRLEAGDLKLENNLWFSFGAGSDLTAITDTADYLETYLADAANNNEIADPNFYGTDRTRGAKGMDPRPRSGSVAWTKGFQSVDDAFFTDVNYIGAFGYSNWMKGWTALDEYGYIKDSAVSNEDNTFNTPSTIVLAQNFPNPFNPTTQISFTLPSAQNVTLQVVDLTGRVVANLAEGMVSAGVQTFTFDASALSSGVYMYQLRTATGVFTKKMTLMK